PAGSWWPAERRPGPPRSNATAASTCVAISVRSASACAVGAIGSDATTAHTPIHAGSARAAREILPGPRAPPRGHDRVLRAALIRAAPLPDGLAARAGGTAGRVELPGDRAEARVPR